MRNKIAKVGMDSGRTSALLLAILVAAGVWRWQATVSEGYVKPDETVYVQAAEHWTDGRSPYDEGNFFYTPFYAAGSAWLAERLGSLGYLQLQRWITLVGTCVATWLAFLLAGWRFWPSVLCGIAWLWLSPVTALPTQIGNTTGLPTALTLAGFAIWRKSAVGAGLALGLGQALKPITPLAPFCFLLFKPIRRENVAQWRPSFVVGSVALATVGVTLLVGLRFLPGLFSNAVGSTNPYNFSAQHVFALFGLNVRPVFLLAGLGVAGLWWIGSRSLTARELMVAALTLNVVAAPILWAHSLLVFFPVQLIAAAEIVRRIRAGSAAGSGANGAMLPHLLALLALASTILAGSVGGPITVADWIRGVILAIPLLSVAYLGAYALRSRGVAQPES